MFHLGLFSSSLADSVLAQISAVTDSLLVVQSNGYVPQSNMEIVGAFAFGANIQRAYLTNPSIRMVTPKYVRPTPQGATYPTQSLIADWRQNPFQIKPMETLEAWGYQDSGVSELQNLAVLLQQGYSTVPTGNVFTMRGTSTTAAVASAWTQLTMTWEDTLPAGRYAVVGSTLVGAAGIAHRVILPNQTLRPGGPILADDTVQGPALFREGRLGTWGYFTSTDVAKLEVYATAATAVWTAYLDLIRLSA